MINTAVILAAGMGTRFKGSLADRPKGFIQIDDKTLIEHSIQKLIKAGLEHILIGTGYSNHYYDNLAEQYEQIKCIKNKNYETTGSMFTLLCTKELLQEDFLLLESDLLYDCSGLDILIKDVHRDVILASGLTFSGDEVFIEIDADSNLSDLSKNRDELNQVYGELTGLSKISLQLFQKLIDYCEKNRGFSQKAHYEECLRALGEPIFVKKEEAFLWCEIDNEDHLRRAMEVVYPKIKEREQLCKN